MSDTSPDRLACIPALAPSSPKRRPLAQRSDSEANSSTIRLVADEPSEVYSKSPFPSHPSHLLPPRVSKLPPQRYAPFVDKDAPVSDENTPTNRPAIKTIQHEAPALKPLRLRRSNRASTSTTTSDAEADTSILTTSTLTTNDTLLTTPSSSRQSSRTTPPSSPIEDGFHNRRYSLLDPVDEETPLASPKSQVASRPTIRAIHPSASSDRLPLHAKASETSLAPSTSTISLPGPSRDTDNEEDTDHDRRPNSPSSGIIQVFPHTSSEISLPEAQTSDLESSPPPSVHSKPIHHYASIESIVLDTARPVSYVDRPRSSSSPARPDSQAFGSPTVHTAIKIQYPVVRPPSTSGSWAEVSSPAPSIVTPRMQDPYRPPQWSSRLSTIASESERSNSYSTSTDSNRRGKRRKTIGSFASGGPLSSFSDARSSEWEYGSGVLTGTESNISIPIPQPLFSPRPLPSVPDESFAQSRDSDERDDIVGELQAPYLRSQRSGILTRFSSKSSLRPSSADSSRSQISFIGDLMWARRYYSNGEPANMIARNYSFVSESSGHARLNTATSGITSSPISETVPSNIWRPRNRPRDEPSQPGRRLRQETRRIYRCKQRRDSVTISEETEAADSQRSRRLRSLSTPDLSVREMMYSPHLRRDRRQTQRYSAWAAPSLDEPFGKAMFSQVNRQILCFALGFILPMGK